MLLQEWALFEAVQQQPVLTFDAYTEIVNAYTELNDPFDQRLRFEEQARQKEQVRRVCFSRYPPADIVTGR